MKAYLGPSQFIFKRERREAEGAICNIDYACNIPSF